MADRNVLSVMSIFRIQRAEIELLYDPHVLQLSANIYECSL